MNKAKKRNKVSKSTKAVEAQFLSEPEDWELEVQGEPDEPQIDTVFVLDGRGRAVRMEVPDDAEDNQA